MNETLIAVSIYVITVIIVVIVLNIIQNKKNNKYKDILDKIEIEKNKIDSAPINSEISKIKNFLKTDKLDSSLKEWEDKFKEIRTTDIPKITDMILEADYSLKQQDYKATIYKIAKLEMEVYKVKTNTELLLDSIKEITSSEEKNRAIIIKLKSVYRELLEQFNKTKNEYSDVANSIILQFENISKRFELFEINMEDNNYTEVTKIIKSIDEMLKHMKIVIDEVPSIVLMSTSILPKKIEEIKVYYTDLIEKGYPLDYLNVDYNIEEAEKKINDVMDRTKVLNLEDNLFELKVLLDYFESLYNDFEREKNDRNIYDDVENNFKNKSQKLNKLMNNVMEKLDSIKEEYNLTDREIEELKKLNNDMKKVNDDYNVLKSHTGNNTFAYSKLVKEIENLLLRINTIQETLEKTLNLLGTIKEDETRARQQLDEINSIIRESKQQLQLYKFPVIPNYYKVELNEASSAIKEIVKELNRKPINVDVLNTRVDTARDLVFKLHGSTKNMLKIARLAELAIVYGNRYRVVLPDIDRVLIKSEELFLNGEYKESLELTINFLNKVEPGIYKKLLNY